MQELIKETFYDCPFLFQAIDGNTYIQENFTILAHFVSADVKQDRMRLIDVHKNNFLWLKNVLSACPVGHQSDL